MALQILLALAKTVVFLGQDLLIWVKVDVSIPLGTSRRKGNHNHKGSPFGGLGRNSVSEGISERSRSANLPNDPWPRPIGTQQPFLPSPSSTPFFFFPFFWKAQGFHVEQFKK
ncbi:hypothetical protein CEXT_453851 [Caerostris extrusa]|uniref:Uncharacterized protein n=1 Tax=Caerostris extrusa TaxID=172846 RepID=A0AAV4WM36_CAEEX|nr:hypothetical protein CEXT_453851 [Caerostris extrusa]